jgi:hypothetical protein
MDPLSDNIYNGFININDFDLDNDGADIREPDNNNRDPIIPLLDTPLETIFKENKDKEEPKPKKTRNGTRILSIRQRIQGLY